jgi:pyruvate formate lyase activating enzyme
VRPNVDGQFHTLNYGVSVQATEETIETDAVNHYQPGHYQSGARILSLGNVGCMMSCTFCHNWETSQVKPSSVDDAVNRREAETRPSARDPWS